MAIDLNLNSFVQTAQHAHSADSTVKLSGNTLKDVGGFRSFFTLPSTHRATMSAFLDSIKQKYGDTAFQMASDRLRGPMGQGKPLTAGMIMQVDAEARNITLVSSNFISGISPDGAPTEHNLDNAIDAYINQMHETALPPGSDMSALRHEIKDAVAKDLLSGRLALGSEEEMFEAVSQGKVGGIRYMLSRESSPAAPEGLLSRTPGNLEDKCRLCALTAAGGTDDSSLIFSSLYLGRMRELQNGGPLTRSTIWQACFSGEALPPAADNPRDFADAFKARLEKLKETQCEGLHNWRGGGKMDSVTHALFQLPYEIIHAAQHEGRDIDVTMRLESLDNITLAAKNRDNGANRETDFRMFTECAGLQLAFNGGPLTFTFHQANNANTTLSMKTREHMVARAWTELRNIVNRGENPEGDAALGDRVRDFVRDFDAQVNQLVPGISEAQRRTLSGAMSQNSNFLLRRLEQAVGHSLDSSNARYAFDISRTSSGDIHVRHSTWTRPEGSGEDSYTERSHLTITIHPDGSIDGTAPVFVSALNAG